MTPPARSSLMERAACVAQVLVADIEAPVFDAADLQHVAKVLRARQGERVSVTDGDGRWRIGEWRNDGIDVVGDVTVEPRSTPEICVCFAVIKGDRSEWAVQKLTEVGVDEIVLLASTDHGVVKWDDDKRQKNTVRLTKVAREAAMQSRRVRLPKVSVVESLSDLGKDVAMAHPGGAPLTIETPKVVVGPEGGWSGSELAMGLSMVDLGPTILRAETAAISLGVQLSALRSF